MKRDLPVSIRLAQRKTQLKQIEKNALLYKLQRFPSNLNQFASDKSDPGLIEKQDI